MTALIVVLELAILVAVVAAVVVTLRSHRKIIAKVDANTSQLVTLNEGTVGSFAADDETRRIEAIPHDQRTPTEQRHLDTAPPHERPQGAGR